MARPASEEIRGERRVRLLLVDDHEVVRKGIRLLVEALFAFEVVEVASAAEAVDAAATGAFDLALVDAHMPEHDGIWAIGNIRAVDPELPVVVLSSYDSEEYVEAALEAGATGYLVKGASTEELRDAIDTALSGRGLYLHPTVASHVFRPRPRRPREEPLSERELEVLQLLAEGATNHQIAALLFLSEKTVKAHLSSIFRKLAVSNRTQAAGKAIRRGLAKPPR